MPELKGTLAKVAVSMSTCMAPAKARETQLSVPGLKDELGQGLLWYPGKAFLSWFSAHAPLFFRFCWPSGTISQACDGLSWLSCDT